MNIVLSFTWIWIMRINFYFIYSYYIFYVRFSFIFPRNMICFWKFLRQNSLSEHSFFYTFSVVAIFPQFMKIFWMRFLKFCHQVYCLMLPNLCIIPSLYYLNNTVKLFFLLFIFFLLCYSTCFIIYFSIDTTGFQFIWYFYFHMKIRTSIFL